jgi:hypothetical protein
LDDKFDSIDLLKGHAAKNDDGNYEMVGSDFLESFIGRRTGKDNLFPKDLLNQDWGWTKDFVEVDGFIEPYKERLGL